MVSQDWLQTCWKKNFDSIGASVVLFHGLKTAIFETMLTTTVMSLSK